MTLLPRSVLGRHALLIVALVVLGQIAGLGLLREFLLKPRFDQLGDAVAREALALRAGLAGLPPPERAGFVERFNRGAGPPSAAADGRAGRVSAVFERRFLRRLAGRLTDAGLQVAVHAGDDGSVVLGLPVGDQRYDIELPGLLQGRAVGGAWIAATLASGLVGLLGALLIQRRVNLPLRRLVDAARTLSRGVTPARLAEDGPVEVAALSRSFNHLVESLVDAERERAVLLAGVSHDLRTPLAKLRLGVEILGDRSEPALMAGMRRSIAEMDAVIGQFLDFARAGADEPATPADLDALAGELAAAGADHGQPLAFEPGRPPAAPMRPQAMRRAVVNLVENAWRHGSPPVTLRTGVDAGGVWIEVADRGPGIAAGDVATLTQPFRRAGTAPGAGLGLAIADRVAREHGGRLELRPNLPNGLRARLTVPTARP